MDIKDAAGKSSEGSENHDRENLNCLRENPNHHKETVIRNLGFKNSAGKDSEEVRNVIGTGGRRSLVVWWQKA